MATTGTKTGNTVICSTATTMERSTAAHRASNDNTATRSHKQRGASNYIAQSTIDESYCTVIIVQQRQQQHLCCFLIDTTSFAMKLHTALAAAVAVCALQVSATVQLTTIFDLTSSTGHELSPLTQHTNGDLYSLSATYETAGKLSF